MDKKSEQTRNITVLRQLEIAERLISQERLGWKGQSKRRARGKIREGSKRRKEGIVVKVISRGSVKIMEFRTQESSSEYALVVTYSQ